jgi:hypothetical protein
MAKIGRAISPLLERIEDTLWLHEHQEGVPPGYTMDGFRAIVKIFMSAMMDKMYELQVKEDLDLEDKKAMAESCGEDLRKLVHTYTGIDTLEMYK